jgi:hypothetical protein
MLIWIPLYEVRGKFNSCENLLGEGRSDQVIHTMEGLLEQFQRRAAILTKAMVLRDAR